MGAKIQKEKDIARFLRSFGVGFYLLMLSECCTFAPATLLSTLNYEHSKRNKKWIFKKTNTLHPTSSGVRW